MALRVLDLTGAMKADAIDRLPSKYSSKPTVGPCSSLQVAMVFTSFAATSAKTIGKMVRPFNSMSKVSLSALLYVR